MQNKIRNSWLIVLGGAVILAAGCHTETKPTSENFMKGLNAYYSTHNECLFPSVLHFPYEVSPGAGQKKEISQMEALADAGLLKRKEEAAIKVNVYTLTQIGERVGGRFCYGHREVTSIDSFTPPVKGPDGFLQTEVTYHYKLADVPVWAKTDKMVSAFPEMAKVVSAGGSGTAKLANAGAGWQIPE